MTKNDSSAGEDNAVAISSAFMENESAIKRFLRRFFSVSHDVEEVSQETFLKAFQAAKSREIEQPKAFLFGVARNIALKRLSKNARAIVEFVEDSQSCGDIADEVSLEDALESRQRMLIFAEAVSTLPAQCQRVFIMKKVYGLSHKEIAARLKISVSTVEKHVANGLFRCGDYMKKKERGAPAADAMRTAAPSRTGRTETGRE